MGLPETSMVRLRVQHHAIRLLIDELEPEQLGLQPAPGTWSITENIAHLGRYQEIFPQRIARILSEDVPAFERYRAELDAGFATWCGMPVGAMLVEMEAGRESLVRAIEALTDDDLHRGGTHPLFGLITIPYWIEFFLLHEAHHIYTVMRLMGRLRQDG